MTCSNNVIEYSIGDTINTPVHFHTDMENGSTMRFVIAVDDTSSPIIDKVFNMNSDGSFTIELTLAERSILKLGKYIYKVIVNGIDGSIRTRQSGYFIVTWFATRDSVINLSTGYKPLVFDNTPTLGSSNPVTSDGIRQVIEEAKSLIADNDADISELGDEIARIKDDKVDKIAHMGLCRFGDNGSGDSWYLSFDTGVESNTTYIYDIAQTDKKISNAVTSLKLQSVPHTTVSGYPITIREHLTNEKLISCTIHGADGGVGDLQEDGSCKISLSVLKKNMFNPEFLKVTPGGVYGYYKMIDTNEDLVMSLRVKDESVTLPDGTAVMFTYRGYDAKYQDDGQAEYLVPIWINNRHMGEYVLNYINGVRLKYFSFYPNSKATIDAIKAKFDIQIEHGTIATEIEPYTPPTNIPIYIDKPLQVGENVKITDVTIPDSDSVTISASASISPPKIDVEYYQDINKVITELKNAILAQGGNV